MDEATIDATAVTDSGAVDSATPDAGFVCTRGTPMMNPGTACNGATELCARRFDQVVYPTTHNAYSTVAEGFGAPNQMRSLTQQLRDGVRGVMLDVHDERGRPMLCHGTCLVGKRLLAEGLCDLRRFLDENPREVLTIIFESYVSAAAVEGAFRSAGLLDTVYAHPMGTPWPTLETMISTGKRLVVFTDREGGRLPWYHDVWDFAWETPFAATTPAELDTCRANRGTRGNPLFIFNHFLTAPLASPELARMVNFNPFLVNRARRCQQETNAVPNFVTIDYYELGDLFAAVRTLNGL